MTKERITYLDSLKGLLIILVMIGHSNTPAILHSLIYAFHMPAFFMLSGMFVKPLTKWGTKDMILKYTKAYLKPYYITVVAIFFITALTFIFSSSHTLILPMDVKSIIIFIAGGASAMCFLFALFWGVITYRVLRKSLSGFTLFGVILFLFIITTMPIHHIPFDIRAGLSSVIFIYAGNMLHINWDYMLKIFNSWITYIIVVVLYIFCICEQSYRCALCNLSIRFNKCCMRCFNFFFLNMQIKIHRLQISELFR